ncbi:ATP-binding protein [Priestia koreensis]|uniref:ATP-binding protein n=1 Tax=Priestia koreensis TaxID=284581 RepID=UPI00345A7ECE
MRKPVDLSSIVSSYRDLPEKTFKTLTSFFEFSMRKNEVEQISDFIDKLSVDGEYFTYFYIGYKIPQIDKEFDLLRFGTNYILNVELKTTLNIDKARKQLQKNKYYLSSISKNVKLFTYVADEQSLYELDDNGNFNLIDFSILDNLLIKQKLEHHQDIDALFDPSSFLVSPFNNVSKFINNSYFLTSQQENFKNQILSGHSQFTTINGLPGTGKTLLLYDIAKELKEKFNVVIVHSGKLNHGHEDLNNEHGWCIIPAKDYEEIKTLSPDFILVDETQRMYPNQLSSIIEYAKQYDIKVVFAIDPKQILSIRERNYKNLNKICSLNNQKLYELSGKIRTNKELGRFIQGIFNLRSMSNCKNTDNISIHYFDDIRKAREFASGLKRENWKVIDYTGQNYGGFSIDKMKLNVGSTNAHSVLGQEFDKVLVLVGSTFYYDKQNSLAVEGADYYDPERMFYQSVTRARKQIMLLIVNNPEFMEKIMDALPS